MGKSANHFLPHIIKLRGKMFMNTRKWLLVSGLFLIGGFPCGSSFAEEFHVAKGEVYVALSLVRNSLTGDFQGNNVLAPTDNPNKNYYVPKVDAGNGIGLAAGIKNGPIAFELGYTQTRHDISYQSGDPQSSNATLHLFAP